MPKKQEELATRSIMTQIILLQPKMETSDEVLASLFKGIHTLQQHIPCIIAVSTGENQSTRHRGFTHGIIIHFEDETHMREAMTHAAYQKMQERVQALCEQTVTLELPEQIPLPVVVQTLPMQEAIPEPKRRGRQKAVPPSALAPPPPVQQQVSGKVPPRKHAIVGIDPRLKAIVVDQLGVDESEVVPSASFVEDLNADSLDLVELIMSFEEVFKITIPDEDAERLTTVGEAQDYLLNREVL